MKAKEIINLSDEELENKLKELKSELFNLRFRHASGQLENPLAINLVKKDIARVNTVIRARQLKAERRQKWKEQRSEKKEQVL